MPHPFNFPRAIAALLPLGLLGALFPATAGAAPLPFSTDVRATGTLSTGQGGSQEDATNNRNPAVMTRFVDDVGNESFASASLAMDEGHLSASDHACSGGAPAFGGAATGGGFVDVSQNYLLTSPSLASGTLVPVHFQFGSAARVIASGANLDFFNDSGGSGAHVALTLDTRGATFVSVNGALNRTVSPDGNQGAVNQTIRSGNYDPDGGTGMVDFMFPVGSSLRLVISADTTAGSTSFGRGAIDGDSQLSVAWGFSAIGDAALVTDDTTNQPAPPASNGAQSMLFLPDRPDTIPLSDLPEPTSLTTLLLCSLAPLARRRRTRR